jgi:UDP-N-acetylglucosamine 2-epimerase (non-hydrolysing)
MLKLLVVFGTRPEAIKLYPVIHALRSDPRMNVRVCVTGQHRGLLDQVLELAEISPDLDLAVMSPNQSLDELTARLLVELGRAFDAERPDRVIVQGDTATAMVGALAAYYRKIPVAHVEAGLRSGNVFHPWPEEVNRRIVAPIADLHFAPTERAAAALRAENLAAAAIHVTGNTVIDALLAMRRRLDEEPHLAASVAPVLERFADKRLILVTSHRRENFGDGMASIASAIRHIAARPDVALIFPVHPNPNVLQPMEAALAGLDNVALIQPLDYAAFVRTLAAAEIVLTDSGGVQEEAPAFGKPVLVMRETTERPEGVEAGTARLVGTDSAKIVEDLGQLLDNRALYERMAKAHNPFGDGQASARILREIKTAHAL